MRSEGSKPARKAWSPIGIGSAGIACAPADGAAGTSGSSPRAIGRREAALMGGTEEARRASELIVEEQRIREWLSGPDTTTWTAENEPNRVD